MYMSEIKWHSLVIFDVQCRYFRRTVNLIITHITIIIIIITIIIIIIIIIISSSIFRPSIIIICNDISL